MVKTKTVRPLSMVGHSECQGTVCLDSRLYPAGNIKSFEASSCPCKEDLKCNLKSTAVGWHGL